MSKIEYKLDIPFKNFQAGQIIQSKQFNEDMLDLEDKINEIIDKHNLSLESFLNHFNDHNNPHQVTCDQIGTYNTVEIDEFVNDLRSGNFNDCCVSNRVMEDNSIGTRNLINRSITPIKVDESFGYSIDISQNIEIANRYTKDEIDKMFTDKVGESTYSKSEIDQKFADVQAGQIVDKTIGIEKLKNDVGEKLDISNNPVITSMYTNTEINGLIQRNGLPRDWGSITESADLDEYKFLPVADVMVADKFIAPESFILDIDIKEVVDARGEHPDLKSRVDKIEDATASTINMFDEVNTDV